MTCAHTHFTKGKRVRVGLKNGTAMVGKFVERLSRCVVLDTDEGRRWVPTAHIAAMSHYQRGRLPRQASEKP